MSYDLPIEQLIQPVILDCPPHTSIRQAAKRMNKARCSSILVIDQGRPVGIWTERDALNMDISDIHNIEQPISTVMSTPVRTIPGHTSIGEVTLRFKQEGVRHYLMVDNEGAPRGIVTQTDVVQNQGVEFYILLREVKSILKTLPPLLSAGQPLTEATRRMRETKQDAVAVEVDGVLGILTERDIVRCISQQRIHATCGEVASKPLVTVSGDASLYHTRRVFTEKKIRHLGVTGDHGELLGVITYSDILDSIEYNYVRELKKTLKEQERRLDESQRYLRLAEKVFESSFEAIMITNIDGVIESVNPAFSEITGYSLQQVIGKTPRMLSSGRHDAEFYHRLWRELLTEGRWQGEIWNRRRNGEVYPEWLSINTVRNERGQPASFVAMFSDITGRKAVEERLHRMAHHDTLTGLPNRALFIEYLEQAIARAHRNHRMAAVMFLDLDRFKLINDTLGHAAGDQLLVATAKTLTGAVRQADTVARLGGDEFTVILEDLADAQDAAAIAQKIIDCLAQPSRLEHQELFVTTSIGISVYPGDGKNGETLLKHADAAMYQAKERGRNNYQFFTPDMNTRAFERLVMENSLRKALERNELLLYYQPQVDINRSRITGMEALLRWRHPDLGLISPAHFIPIAEETGLIVPIGEWVLRTACAQNAAWRKAGYPALRVAVNLSLRQFHQTDLVEQVRLALKETGLEPQGLELEITESMAMEHAEDTIVKLQQLKALGVSISMDDFGAGHSSLSYLKRLPIDTLKIDKSFVEDLGDGSGDAVISRAIADMAKGLRLKVISEGIETEEQLAFLKAHNNSEVQGYLFSHPLPAEEFAELLKNPLPGGRPPS